MQKFRKIFRGFRIALRVVVIAAVVLLAVYNACMLIQRYAYGNDFPTVFGYGSAVVVSGSMEPEISVNDLVIVKAEDSYELNDVITFYDAASGTYITHRIILVEGEMYATKGDANSAADLFSVPQTAVVGKVVSVLRGAGKAVSFFQSPLGLLTVIGGGVVLWLIADVVSNVLKDKQEKEDEQK